MDPIRHEYRQKLWHKTLCLVIVLFMGFAGAVFAYESVVLPDWRIFLFSLGVFAVAANFLLLMVRSRLVIDSQRIAVRYYFREHSANLSEITGYREFVSVKYPTYWKLELKGGRKPISIQGSFKGGDELRAWLRQLPNLDRRERRFD